MKISRDLKRFFWFLDAYFASKKYALNESLVYLGITGTDGKTTTSSLLYEEARAMGYKPLLLTTVGAKFDGNDIPLNIKSTTFFAYSLKTFFAKIIRFKIIEALTAIFFLDKKGFEEQREQHRTTPLASEIRKTILEYEAKGANLFIIETTSHALDQYRVYGINFDSVAFTNITNEHLDYHGTWENYAETKAKLISMVNDGGSVTINLDDKKSYDFLRKKVEEVAKVKKLKLFEYRVADWEKVSPANFLIKIKKFAGTNTKTDTPSPNLEIHQLIADESNSKTSTQNQFKVSLQILGKFNLSNSLAAFGCFYGFNNTNGQALAEGLSNLKAIKGRMQVMNINPSVIIDFAHTPNGMENALKAVKVKEGGRLWVIFGCAGERDKYKRPVMGKIAFDNADNILITSEDPRSENLLQINNEIIEGFRNEDTDFTIETYYEGLEYNPEGKFVVRFDEPNLNSRINAIQFAIQNANPNDTIITLGKGHESSMNYAGIEYDWDEEKVVRESL